ncbi:hypothetical protein CAPTEDRAFT_192702 [Capitella teleta]|uniref:Uncharacterized protein n=1 Tax=Capitella teleta TaxID=283909 RepID=R7V4M4_CAPTE|nr:hypothetical protein CAPTEDRAFT_192702 [Capitella teleta]|eukprot:ELU11311.1 hypothetical protein CAPTEDRAFT_192702 [Capitella teleta]
MAVRLSCRHDKRMLTTLSTEHQSILKYSVCIKTDIQNQAGSSENSDGDDNESDDPIIVSMDLDWENCHPSSCLEPLAADEALPEEERLPPCRTGDNHLYCWGDGEKAHNPKGKMF